MIYMSDEVKNISIRGVNSDVYEQFSNKIKVHEMTIGDAISKMMGDVVADFDETFPEISAASLRAIAGLRKGSIQHQGRVSVSKKDLVDADMRFYFQHIKVLEFEDDVDLETFEKYVGGIQHVTSVRIPAILPKLKLLAYIQFCKEIEVYEVE